MLRSTRLNLAVIALTLGYATIMYLMIQPSVEIVNLVAWSTSPLLLLMSFTVLFRNHRIRWIMATLLVVVGVAGVLVLAWGSMTKSTEINLIILFLPTYQIAFSIATLALVGLTSLATKLFKTKFSR